MLLSWCVEGTQNPPKAWRISAPVFNTCISLHYTVPGLHVGLLYSVLAGGRLKPWEDCKPQFWGRHHCLSQEEASFPQLTAEFSQNLILQFRHLPIHHLCDQTLIWGPQSQKGCPTAWTTIRLAELMPSSVTRGVHYNRELFQWPVDQHPQQKVNITLQDLVHTIRPGIHNSP